MTFIEAVKAADKGGKIRLPFWSKGEYFEVHGEILVWASYANFWRRTTYDHRPADNSVSVLWRSSCY